MLEGSAKVLVSSPPEGVERPTGGLTPKSIWLIEDAVRLPPYFCTLTDSATKELCFGLHLPAMYFFEMIAVSLRAASAKIAQANSQLNYFPA
jgi:hypothetical protein